MLQRIIAAVLLVAGLVAVGLGIASATVWRDSDTVTATTAFTGEGTMLVTEPGVLDLVDADVTIRATAPGEQEVTLVVGREVDVTGWVGQEPHGVVTGLSDWDRLATTQVTPDEAAAEDEAPAEGTETPAEEAEETAEADEAAAVGVDPAGSDMWVAEASGAGSASLRWSDQPGRWQLLAAGVGEGATAPTLELSWPREVETPYLWPGVIGGIVLVLLGLGIGAASMRPGRRKTSGRRGETGATPVVTPGGEDAGRTPAASGTPDRTEEPPADTAEVRTLTRRQLREREEAERLAAQPGRPQKPRRAWLTGQIPVVPRDKRPKTAAQPVVDPTATQPTEQDSATTRADAWRRAWGFSAGSSEPGTPGPGTPSDETDETKDSSR